MRRNGLMKLVVGMAFMLGTLAVCAQSPAHEALRKEIAALRAKPEVYKLPAYLADDADFGEACDKAGREKKIVLVSIGREACGRCERFYELLRTGAVKFDSKQVAFIRLDIDNPTHREYFFSTFEPPDNRLPFVGVTKADRNEVKSCLTGAPAPAVYQKLITDALPKPKSAAKSATPAKK